MITSTANPRIRDLLKLSKARQRKEEGVFTIEGIREIKRALSGGYEIREAFLCPELFQPGNLDLSSSFPSERITEVSEHVFSRIAYRDNTDGILVVSKMKEHNPEHFRFPAGGLYLVAESVEKPGNFGALLRTADAASADAVFLCDSQTDLYNPNIVRSSLGCLFTLPVFTGESENIIALLKKNEVRIFPAALQNSRLYYEADFCGASALVLGSEAEGLSTPWRAAADMILKIPMKGIADSLNVSVAAGILLFEAIRQRDRRE